MTPQMVILLDEGLAHEFARSFGADAFAEWVGRMRAEGYMHEAWSDRKAPPPVSFLLSEGLSDRLLSQEDREAMGRLEFDEWGVVRGRRFAVRVVAVETSFEDVPLEMKAWLTAVPSDEAKGG